MITSNASKNIAARVLSKVNKYLSRNSYPLLVINRKSILGLFQNMSGNQLKISDIIKTRRKSTTKPFFSMEVSPGVAESVMSNKDSLFYSVTWLSQHNDLENLNLASLDLAEKLSSTGHNVLLHITCTDMSITKLDRILEECRIIGVVNLFVLTGDKSHSFPEGDFKYASDMVRHIRIKYQDEFCIGVAAYPEGHHKSSKHEDDMASLKRKVDCGANFIITQAFFEFSIFKNFSDSCRLFDITVPIIPGIFIPNYATSTFAKICHLNIPNWLGDELTSLNDNAGAIEEYGNKLSTDLILEILDRVPEVSGFHFFTFNKISPILHIWEILGLQKINST